jgi:hypothetical protein
MLQLDRHGKYDFDPERSCVQCSLNVQSMEPQCSLNVAAQPLRQVRFQPGAGEDGRSMFNQWTLNAPSIFNQWTLTVPSMFPEHAINGLSMDPQRSLNVP